MTEVVVTFLALLTIAADLAVVALVVVLLAARRGVGWALAARAYVSPAALPLAWLVAAVATSGSLFYSEVAHFVPCSLCWYQRIAMYPMVLLLGIAAVRKDTGIAPYAMSLAGAGTLISIYHYQLERFPMQASVGCSADASCTVLWVWRFHFISIPFEALSGFLLIGLLMIAARTRAPSRGAAASLPHRQEVTV